MVIGEQYPERKTAVKKPFDSVMVIGGGGYVGAVLVPKLLEAGCRVKVYDLFIYASSSV